MGDACSKPRASTKDKWSVSQRQLLLGPLVVVTGGSGNVGSATVHAFNLHAPHGNLRVATRDVHKTAQKLKGVDALHFSVCNPEKKETLEATFRSAKTALIVPPPNNRVQATKAYIDAAKAAKLSFIAVISSVWSDTKELS